MTKKQNPSVTTDFFVVMTRSVFGKNLGGKLGMIAEKTGCAIVLIGHLNKSSGTQSTYRGLGSIDIMAALPKMEVDR